MVNPVSNNPGLLHSAAPNTMPQSTPQVAAAVKVTGVSKGQNEGDATAKNRSASPGADTFEQINAAMKEWNTGMKFEVDEDTQKVVVSIVDTKSGEVIRQIPSEEVLHIAKMITQFQGRRISTEA